MTKIIIHGFSGKMGQTVYEVCKKIENVEVVAGIDYTLNKSAKIPIFSSIDECDIDCDVVVDFSTAIAIPKLIEDCLVKKLPIVICTTGISNETMDKIINSSKFIPIFMSYNMSLGVNIISELLSSISQVLYDSNFDIEIIEKHHNNKIDAPSGTALLLANSIKNNVNESLKHVYDRSELIQKRNKNEIGIHSLRGGTITGEHSVIFAGQDEVIEIKHTAYSKEVFANGAINACKFLHTTNGKAGMYDMKDILKYKLN